MTSRTHFSRREFVAMGVGTAASSALPAFAASQDLATLTLKQASDVIRRREASPVDLTQACLNRIDKYNPSINAFITVTRDQALATAYPVAGPLCRVLASKAAAPSVVPRGRRNDNPANFPASL